MRLTLDDALARYVAVTLDGEDVTNACTVANEGALVGMVERLRLTPVPGKRGVFTGDERYITHGTVVITLHSNAPEWAKTLYLRARIVEALGP